MHTLPSSMRWFSKGDLGAFWALFADNLANLILIMGVCGFVFKMPPEVVYGHILPGLGMALLLGLLVYTYLARRLMVRYGRSKVTALPYGISTPILFVYLFGVIGPVYAMTGNARTAWQVGLAASFLGGLVEMAGSLAGPWLKKNLPRAGMLGTLAGIALVFIAAVPMAEVFEHPIIGLPCLVVVLVGLVAGIKLPAGLPAGLAAIVLGIAIGLCTGDSKISFDGIGFYPPVPVWSDLWSGLQAMLDNSWVFAVVIPAEIYNFIETMNNVESAEAAGDAYPVRTCQLVDGAGTLVGAVFGSAFPTTVFIGHPGYKRMGARTGYTLGVGVVVFLAALFGGLKFLHGLVPLAAVAPILVFIGLVMTAQAFWSTPKAHAMAVAVAMLPHVSNLLMVKWEALRTSMAGMMSEPLPELVSLTMQSAMLQQGAHVAGHAALSAGSILVGLLWGAATAFLVDRAWVKAALVLGSCGVLSMFGIIHGAKLEIGCGKLVWVYLGLALALMVVGLSERYGRAGLKESNPQAHR